MTLRPPASGRVRTAGLVVLAVGLWGAVIPFVGPSFGYSMGGTPAWTWTESSATLHLVPGLAAVLGGALLLVSRRQSARTSGALIAVLGGTWFLIAPSLRPLWATEGSGAMTGGGMMNHGSAVSDALQALGYHYGTGAIITAVAAYALGMLVSARATETAGRPAGADVTSAQAVTASRESTSVSS